MYSFDELSIVITVEMDEPLIPTEFIELKTMNDGELLWYLRYGKQFLLPVIPTIDCIRRKKFSSLSIRLEEYIRTFRPDFIRKYNVFL